MNEHDESEMAPPPIFSAPGIAAAERPKPRPVFYWGRRLLVCNPFYLVSAALLLFGLYRVSIDRDFFTNEVAQLAFNLTSLQVYEILLVVTAIFLAHRRIWYESTLLAALENMLLFVPFILVSQAALINEESVWAVCLAVSILAIVRGGSLKRFFKELNLPNRLLGIGLVLLAVNVALLVTYRIVEQTKLGGKPDSGPEYVVNQITWLVILPAALALANFLPYARETGSLLPQRRWLPAALFSLWITATGVHLYCLNYVYDFYFRSEMVAPFFWVLAWTVCLRAPDFVALRGRVLQNALLIAPVPVTLLAATHHGSTVFITLTALNTAIYGALCFFRRDRRLAGHLLFASMVLLAAGLPEPWTHSVLPAFNPAKCLLAGAISYLVVCAALSRDPRLGILGSVTVALAVVVLFRNSAGAIHWALQSALVFLLAHSLRWDDALHPGARAIRIMGAAFWATHAFVWMRLGGEPWMTCVSGAVVLGIYIAVQLLRGRWDEIILPVAAILVVLAGPGNSFAGKAYSTPTGVLAVIGSFVLFALGTAVALTKHRWHPASE